MTSGAADYAVTVALRVGTDLVSVHAVEESVRVHAARYLDRIYTEGEQRDCRDEEGVDPARLAARFAAKEAALKVLRPGRDDAVPWREIEVVRQPAGWVQLRLTGRAADRATETGVTGLAVSLAHEAAFASAVVVAEMAEGDE